MSKEPSSPKPSFITSISQTLLKMNYHPVLCPRHWWDNTQACNWHRLSPMQGIKYVVKRQWKYTVLPNKTGGNILYLHRGFCQYCWVWIQGLQEQMNHSLRNWVQLCSHRLSAHDLSFPLSSKSHQRLQMKGTKQMKHKWTLKWPIRKTPTDGHQNRKSWGDPLP